ncbi:MAG: 50S ribosomal protein L19 [Candidatus Niyogibacteria bacterium]|nr:50S ribosomal protein L19 [Candidatus Niyogibacteria bacterium]
MALTLPFSPIHIEERKKLDIRPGDTVRVWQRVTETDSAKPGATKSRLQAFEGLIIARKHGTEPGATFTVRKMTQGIGVERIFPLYSPTIEKIELVSRSSVRRAKLYYIRDKAAREMRKKMKNLEYMDTTVLDTETVKEDTEDTADKKPAKNKKK